MHADQREPVSYRDDGAERPPRPDSGAAAEPGAAGELTFPDVPRLELDTLLAQLIDRAQEVVSTQGRLRGLLTATRMITADLALPVVLHQIAVAARDLVGARYAALGVIAPDGHLSEFVHVGMPEERVEQIGQLPQGKGLLGALIDDPVPIRLDTLGQDDRSSGFPPGHPPMDSFLGVPVRVRDEVFGNLYLAESTRGVFSAEDEELVTALAASAGVVIANARLYEAAQDRHKWLQASAMITRELLSPDPEGTARPLQLIAEQCRDIAGADLVTVVLPTEGVVSGPPDLRVEIAVGNGDSMDQLVGRPLSLEASLAGRVFTSGQPLRMSNPYELVATPALSDVVDVGPVLVVPLKGSQRMHGVLTAARLRGCATFSAEDLDMATGFATQASMAIELAEARAEQQRAAMFEERDRIAADLHDHVIQRLFATGLSLQSVTAGLAPGRGRDRVMTAINDLDDTIKQIRTSIFQLNRAPNAGGSDVRSRMLEVVTKQTPVLGFEPSIRFDGVLFENVLAESVVEDLLAVLREALSNVARHAGAHSVVVNATTGGGRLSLEVIDDGCGLGPSTRRSGLGNLRHRAENHGGTFTVSGNEPSGTRLVWSIPTT